MNRQIKFRAWDGKKFIDLQKITPLALSDPEMKGLFIPDLPHLIIEQFTGLLDKNGKEIYEGDVVDYKTVDKKCSKCKDEDSNGDFCGKCGGKMKDKIHNGEVTFSNGSFCLKSKYKDFDLYTETRISEVYIQDMVVIGNIHEKHELIPNK